MGRPPSPRFVLALDQGTTSSRAVLFDRQARPVRIARRPVTQHFPQPGWVEHDTEELWSGTLAAAREVLAAEGVSSTDVAAVGITNQRETTLLWDRRTGQPVAPAIVWQDRRTADICDRLKADGVEPAVQRATGLVLDPYFSATKLAWLLDHVPDARSRADRGELAFGTIDSWLVWKLTGGRVHATDVTNASRTLLYDLHAARWSDEMLARFAVPAAVLPDVLPSGGDFGTADAQWLGGPLPIRGVAGDQQAALFGQACFTPGLAKTTYGTGCFALLNVGDRPAVSRAKLLSTVAWQTAANGRTSTRYALEGSVFNGGATVQWLRDGLGLVASTDEVAALAASVPDTGGVYLVPAFTGLGAPHWDAYARGAIVGLTRGTTKAHLARAAVEAIAFQVADVLDVMARDGGLPIDELRADGGAAANDLLLQFQADLLRRPVVRPLCLETTALGAAMLAGLTVGFWQDAAELATLWRRDRTFEPVLGADEAAARRRRWSAAVDRSRDWERGA